MRLVFLSVLVTWLLNSCNSSKPASLENAFILSLQKNDFELLNDFLPERNFYNAISEKMPAKTDKEIEDFLKESHERIREAWQNTYYNAAEKKIDPGKIAIKEVIYHDPFPNDEISEGMIINYEYNGNVWDDIQFIVSRKTGKITLLEIPNPTRAFTMLDTELRATNEAKAWIEISKPEFNREIGELSDKLVAAAKSNNLDELGPHLVYRGADESRLWKTAINMNDSSERQLAAGFLQRLNKNLENCTNYKTGNFITNRESEGLWITWPLDCGDKIITLHYLRIGGRLLLGDTDVEQKTSAAE